MSDQLDGSVIDALASVSIPVTDERSLSLPELLRGWLAHVDRLAAESQATLIRDSMTWGADDYGGALGLRSFIEQSKDGMSSDLVARLGNWLQSVDNKLRAFTKIDQNGLLARWLHEEIPDQWWRRRIPRSGPILDDLTSI